MNRDPLFVAAATATQPRRLIAVTTLYMGYAEPVEWDGVGPFPPIMGDALMVEKMARQLMNAVRFQRIVFATPSGSDIRSAIVVQSRANAADLLKGVMEMIMTRWQESGVHNHTVAPAEVEFFDLGGQRPPDWATGLDPRVRPYTWDY
jgi:hypothetical protein